MRTEKLTKIERIKTKKIPVILKFKRKDGTTLKVKATKCVVDTTKSGKVNK